MNNQTRGPIKVDPAHPITLCRGMSTHGELAMTFGLSQATKDAALYAAAYSAFDKAGRELSMDATKLAQRIDIAGLVRVCRALLAESDSIHVDVAREAAAQLAKATVID